MPKKPSHEEEEYFKKKELELLKKFEEEREALKEAQERENCRRFIYLKCPKCFGDLKEKKYKDITIEQCVECGGVYLDSGDLEMLAECQHGFIEGLFKHVTR
jgi:ferredoxin-like protein FixX